MILTKLSCEVVLVLWMQLIAKDFCIRRKWLMICVFKVKVAEFKGEIFAVTWVHDLNPLIQQFSLSACDVLCVCRQLEGGFYGFYRILVGLSSDLLNGSVFLKLWFGTQGQKSVLMNLEAKTVSGCFWVFLCYNICYLQTMI